MGQCMAVGQAAGVAAVLATQTGRPPRSVNVPQLQNSLRTLGALLD
jgi:hypothetical protein